MLCNYKQLGLLENLESSNLSSILLVNRNATGYCVGKLIRRVMAICEKGKKCNFL